MQMHTPSRQVRRPQARQRLELGAATLLAVVLGAALASQARAAQAGDPAAGGALLLRGKGLATEMPAVRLGTDMDVRVSGTIMRVRVTQAFRNTSGAWMEASYLYPLPDDGAVDTMNMVVGQRVIEGRIKAREEAREIYEKALAKSRKAGLIESERANLFRTQVANVGPGETVLVSIEYQAPVRLVDGEYSMRLPLVVGPRYVPPHTLTSRAAVEDAASVTAPLAGPDLGRSLNPVSITVNLAPGFDPQGIVSPYHRVSIGKAGEGQRRVTLAQGEEPADRDFELRWHSGEASPALGLFRQDFEGASYVMATITPQVRIEAQTAPAREMVFVIDNSGSMGGESMAAAKQSLVHALGTLRPQDRFNVIRFDDTMTQLFEQAIPATPEQVALARTFAEGLEAAGGTEMLPALKAALVDATPEASTVRQVVFLTDGSLSNEQEMMAEIAANAGRSRVFMVGIGSAPNAFLMRRMAEVGRGTYTNIGEGGEVMTKMTAMLERLRAPAVQDLAVRVEGAALDLTPRRLPDLYGGEPLVLLGKGEAVRGRLVVSGTIDGKPWSQSVDLSQASESESIARLWAGRAIADVEAARWSSQIDDEAADKAIARLGLDYHLVTTQTSLVAVEKARARPRGERLTREELPLLLPKGWSFDSLFGGDVPTGASDDPAPAMQQDLDLPQTATGWLGAALRGFALLAAGLGGLAVLRRRKGA